MATCLAKLDSQLMWLLCPEVSKTDAATCSDIRLAPVTKWLDKPTGQQGCCLLDSQQQGSSTSNSPLPTAGQHSITQAELQLRHIKCSQHKGVIWRHIHMCQEWLVRHRLTIPAQPLFHTSTPIPLNNSSISMPYTHRLRTLRSILPAKPDVCAMFFRSLHSRRCFCSNVNCIMRRQLQGTPTPVSSSDMLYASVPNVLRKPNNTHWTVPKGLFKTLNTEWMRNHPGRQARDTMCGVLYSSHTPGW